VRLAVLGGAGVVDETRRAIDSGFPNSSLYPYDVIRASDTVDWPDTRRRRDGRGPDRDELPPSRRVHNAPAGCR
jgi:hypothetical protein